ncbi:MAG: hypothetical protein ABI387_10820 [Lacunisphaera sp.]
MTRVIVECKSGKKSYDVPTDGQSSHAGRVGHQPGIVVRQPSWGSAFPD